MLLNYFMLISFFVCFAISEKEREFVDCNADTLAKNEVIIKENLEIREENKRIRELIKNI